MQDRPCLGARAGDQRLGTANVLPRLPDGVLCRQLAATCRCEAGTTALAGLALRDGGHVEPLGRNAHACDTTM